MKKLMKKVSVIVVSIAMLFSVTGCSSEEKQDGKVTIEYWHINSETFGGPAVSELIEEFNSSQDEIIVEEKFIPSDYVGVMQEMQTAAVSDDIPDLVQIGWPYVEYFSNNFEYSTPEELIEAYGSNENLLEESYEQSVMDLAINSNGDRVGFAYGISTATLYVNETQLAKIGKTIDDVQTWQDIKEVSDLYKEETGDYGLYIAEWNSVWEVQQLVESNGVQFITDGKSSINSPEAVEAYTLYTDMVLESQSALHAQNDEGKQAFLNGEVAMFYGSISENVSIENVIGDDVRVVPAPSFDGEERVAPIGGNFLAVTAASDEEKAATLKFVEFLLEPESMVKWTSGVGYIPHIKGIDESLMHENVYANAQVLEDSVPWYCFPGNEGLNAEQILISYRDKMLGGTMPVEEALEKIDEEINALYE